MTVQHIVLFRFPEKLTADQAADMRSIIKAWPERIGTPTKLRFGTDIAAAGDRTRGFQYLLMMEFDSVDTYLAYRDHEAHLRLSAFIRPLNCDVLAFDYPLDDDTALLPE